MSVFTFHLVEVPFAKSFQWLVNPLDSKTIKGLVHIENMLNMTLGAPMLSPKRILLGQAAIFAQWEDERAIDSFLKDHPIGITLSKGWHVRLKYVHQWGSINGFKIPTESEKSYDPTKPVVAITLARMKISQVPRFIRWGRPVEKLVRDHPGTLFSLAATRPPKTVSTFSIWRSENEMTNMVHGKSKVNTPKRHVNAMKERNRKDFHTQFTTLRFKPIGEFGVWKGKMNIISNITIS